MKRYVFFIIGFLLLLVLAIVIQGNMDKPQDWTPTYSQYDKIPYGTYIIRKILPEVFKGQAITDNLTESTYILTEDSDYISHNFIILDQEFSPDDVEAKRLLELADSGNTLFISANYFNGKFADSLHIRFGEASFQLKDTGTYNFGFVNTKSLPIRKFTYKNNLAGGYFTGFDSALTTVLGHNGDSVNFIKIRHGKGDIYLHCAPVAFTNYYLVDNKTREYPFYCLSYLPKQSVIWNEYYQAANKSKASPLRYIFSKEPLLWSFWILIIGLLIYIIFEAKRQQRIIPLLDPYKNTTLEFADTLGRLYYNQADHKDLANKKILYFFDFLRSKLYLRTDNIDQEFYKRFREKTGISSQDTAALFVNIDRIRAIPHIEEKDLLELNRAIDRFYAKMN